MRALAWITVLAAGLTFGGALHMLRISDAAVAAMQRHNLDTFQWGLKPPGEQMALYVALYLFNCSFPFVCGLLLATHTLSNRRMSGVTRGFPWHVADLLPVCAWFLLGVALAAGLNLLIVEYGYRDAATEIDSYAAMTIAVGLPAMRDLTARYVGAVAALLVLVACIAIVSRRPARPLAVDR